MDSTTTIDYDEFYKDHTLPAPCDRQGDNNLGGYLSILYYFIFFFSLCGNMLVLVIIHRFERLTTVTNILLLNLVASSLIFVTSLPFLAVYQQLTTWIFGDFMCKLVGAVNYLGFYSSVLFLTLLTFDRHLAVVYSLEAQRVRCRRYAVISCVVVWLVSFLVCVKEMFLHKTFFYPVDNKTYCQDDGRDEGNEAIVRESGFYIQLFLFLIFPLVVVVYCYIRIAITVLSSKIVTKFKTVRLIFFIVLLFFLCWTPYNIVVLLRDRAEKQGVSCEESKRLAYSYHVTRNLTFLYFCISPIFYTFVGKKFQNYFRLLLVKRFPFLRKHVSVSQPSGTIMSTKSTQNAL